MSSSEGVRGAVTLGEPLLYGVMGSGQVDHDAAVRGDGFGQVDGVVEGRDLSSR